MKYFTLDWWRGGDPKAVQRYSAYVHSVRPHLPAEVGRFLDEVNLHDARLRTLEVDVVDHRLDMGLDGFHYGLDGNEVSRRSISLSYLNLQRMRTTDDPTESLPGPDGFGDLGYDEIELMPDFPSNTDSFLQRHEIQGSIGAGSRRAGRGCPSQMSGREFHDPFFLFRRI